MKTTQVQLTMPRIVVGILLIAVNITQAETVFFDDFNDGSVTNEVPLDRNGNPVKWTPEYPGMYDASSGDFVLTPTEQTGPQAGIVASVDDVVLSDSSTRAVVYIEQPGSYRGLGIEARRNREDQTGYVAFVTDSPRRMLLDRNEVGSSGLTRLGEFFIPHTVVKRDLFLQLDVEGTTLRAWVWPTTEPMPLQPQIEVTDATFSEGLPAVWVSTDIAGNGGGVFRSVHVADMHIPEPSSAALASVGFVCLLARIRRRPA